MSPTISTLLCVSLTAGALCGASLTARASGKTTDTTTSTSSGGGSTTSGGTTSGGGGSTTTGGGGSTISGGGTSTNSNKPGAGTVAPAPTPIVSSNLTFAASGPINGVTPVATGSYQIDPYYPTLSLMTVNVQASSVDLVDGTILYVSVLTGSNLYGNSGSSLMLVAGAGACTISAYVSPGTTVTGVIISDAFGNPLLVGN